MKNLFKKRFKKAARLLFKKQPIGCCSAFYDVTGNLRGAQELQRLFTDLYRFHSPFVFDDYWMGPCTDEYKEHRVMALLFAAEFYKDFTLCV